MKGRKAVWNADFLLPNNPNEDRFLSEYVHDVKTAYLTWEVRTTVFLLCKYIELYLQEKYAGHKKQIRMQCKTRFIFVGFHKNIDISQGW